MHFNADSLLNSWIYNTDFKLNVFASSPGYPLLIPHTEYRQRFLSGTLPAATALHDNMSGFTPFLFEQHALWTDMFEEVRARAD